VPHEGEPGQPASTRPSRRRRRRPPGSGASRDAGGNGVNTSRKDRQKAASGNGPRANGVPVNTAKVDGARSEAARRPIYAAIDLGTNNCRLLVARVLDRGFVVIDSFSRTVCLGEGVRTNGVLSQEAMARTLDALGVCAEKIRRHRVTATRAIATEACRVASNGAAFVDLVRAETGLDFEVITAEEEARLAARGCMPLLDDAADQALVFDIGGGSTELVWVERPAPRKASQDGNRHRRRQRPRITAWASIPDGVVTLAERHGLGGHSGVVPPDVYQTMIEEVKSHLLGNESLAGTLPFTPRDGLHMLGTSGTVTTLAGLHLGLMRYDRSRVDGSWIAVPQMRALCQRLSGLDQTERAATPCIGHDRADLILAGCAIFEAIAELWPCERLRIADRGLREGMLLALMEQDRNDRPRRRRGRRGGRGKRPGSPASASTTSTNAQP
jgi:exopolyphosphatase/guanosine-5'-triphosphate,3'-diphosphate pyrophosphatase